MNDVNVEAATMCFACGPDNPIGLGIHFALDDAGRCTAVFTPNENHVGYEDTVHGGIVYAALDDVMANVLYLGNRKAHTARCEIRYRRALQVGRTVTLAGWVVKERGRVVDLVGEARLQGSNDLVASATARFMLV